MKLEEIQVKNKKKKTKWEFTAISAYTPNLCIKKKNYIMAPNVYNGWKKGNLGHNFICCGCSWRAFGKDKFLLYTFGNRIKKNQRKLPQTIYMYHKPSEYNIHCDLWSKILYIDMKSIYIGGVPIYMKLEHRLHIGHNED